VSSVSSYIYIYIYIYIHIGIHTYKRVIKCAAYGVAQGGGWRYGFVNINDMYNNDVGT